MPERIFLLFLEVGLAVALITPIVIALSSYVRRRRAAPMTRTAAPTPRPARPSAHDAFAAQLSFAEPGRTAGPRRQILLVDDDHRLRMLLRETLADAEIELEEASSVAEAAMLIRYRRPSVVILEAELPDGNGLTICRQLKSSADPPAVILLTAAEIGEREAMAAGADALLRKPFSPLALIEVLDRITGERARASREAPPEEADQLLLYARDVKRLFESERTQRRLLQQAYRETTSALAEALEAKDRHTGIHALRVQAYALELAKIVSPGLLDDPSLEHGFLLHDIGKIAIPDPILNKRGPLDERERELIRQHPVIGVEILRNVVLLQGEGLGVVRSHHERWDGAGYPDSLAGTDIPLGARVFAVADALDAMTTDRPYRKAIGWENAIEEILTQEGRQFDPQVVGAFTRREPSLRRLHGEFVGSMAA